jgi:outer membrane protein
MPRRSSAALWLALVGLASPIPAGAETLSDAISLAYQTNPTLRAQRADLRATDEGLVQARAGFGPSVTVTVGRTYDRARVDQTSIFGSNTSLDKATTQDTNLSLVQPLFSGGATTARVNEATAQILAGRQNLRQTEAQVLQDAITAYVDVRRDQLSLQITDEQIGLLDRQLGEVRAKDAVKQLTRTDVAQAESRWLGAKSQRVLALGRLETSRARYLSVVGQYPGALAEEPELPGIPAKANEAFDAALANNPRLRAAIFVEAGARARVAEARAALLPSVSLRVEAGETPLAPYQANTYERGFTAGAVVTQPLFSSGLLSSRVHEAQQRDNREADNIEAARRATVQSVAEAWNAFTSAHAAVEFQLAQLSAQTIAFNGNEIEERVGLRSTIDVLNAEQELETINISLLQSRRDEYVARAALLASMGLLEVTLLAPDAPVYRPETGGRTTLLDLMPWTAAVEALDGLAGHSPAARRLAPAGAGLDRPRVFDDATAPASQPAR